MSAGKRYVLIFSFLLIYFIGKTEQNEKSPKRKERHFFPLLGYIHGYRTAQNFLQFPPYFFSPIIVLPSVTQQQAVNIQKSQADESYQESGGIFQYIQSSKLILNTDPDNKPKAKDFNPFKNNFNDEKDIARQAIEDDANNKDNIKISSTSTGNINETKHENAIVNETVMTNSDKVQNITKDDIGILSELMVPSDKNHNFTITSNTTNESITNIEPTTANYNETYNSDDNSNETYPNAWYDNGLVDKIRITTPYEESSSNNDGWHSETSINSLSGFRPLAGLYYDGFLDKPVTKRSGFAPIKSKVDSQFLH